MSSNPFATLAPNNNSFAAGPKTPQNELANGGRQKSNELDIDHLAVSGRNQQQQKSSSSNSNSGVVSPTAASNARIAAMEFPPSSTPRRSVNPSPTGTLSASDQQQFQLQQQQTQNQQQQSSRNKNRRSSASSGMINMSSVSSSNNIADEEDTDALFRVEQEHRKQHFEMIQRDFVEKNNSKMMDHHHHNNNDDDQDAADYLFGEEQTAATGGAMPKNGIAVVKSPTTVVIGGNNIFKKPPPIDIVPAPAHSCPEDLNEAVHSDSRLHRPHDIALEYNRALLFRYSLVTGCLAIPLLYLTPVVGILLSFPGFLVAYWSYQKARFQHGGDVRACVNRDCSISVGIVFISIALLLDCFNVVDLVVGGNQNSSKIDPTPLLVPSAKGTTTTTTTTPNNNNNHQGLLKGAAPPPSTTTVAKTTTTTLDPIFDPYVNTREPDSPNPYPYTHKHEAASFSLKLREAEIAAGSLVFLPAFFTLRYLLRIRRLVMNPDVNEDPESPAYGSNV